MRKVILTLAAFLVLNAQAAQPNDTVSAHLYRLFTPLTFYHGVAGSMLSIDTMHTDVDDAVNHALMNVYLTRPDLVKTTDRQLENAGTLRQDIDKPIEQYVELVEQVMPVPDEPEVVTPEVVVTKPKFWSYKGDGSLQFMQNYVSDNWYKGGESNYSAVGALTLEANYDNKSKWKWENKLEMKLGFQTSPSDTVHKFKSNNDLLRYTGKVGLQAANRWYYTLQMLAYTQFARGFKANKTKVFSDFMSPFNFNIGLGMDYKVEWLNKKITGTINISPLAVNYRYVDRTDLARNFGVKVDRHTHSLTDFGSQLTASLQWKMSDNVTWRSRIYGFSSYHRAEVEWENTFNLKVSKYISANLFLFPRFDDSGSPDADLGYFQFKEYSSLGFSYNF
jgi:hypothetical protein